LLGHEYLKLQNTHAAIDSYRHAVDLNNKDYRAFVGLGQAYEVLETPTFSLYYYRRAVALRPGDMDLWQMIATCLTGMSRIPQAIDALKRLLFARNIILGTILEMTSIPYVDASSCSTS
jgi:Tfp pilus assembly protein PilF